MWCLSIMFQYLHGNSGIFHQQKLPKTPRNSRWETPEAFGHELHHQHQDPDKSWVFLSENFPACFTHEFIWTDDVFTSHTHTHRSASGCERRHTFTYPCSFLLDLVLRGFGKYLKVLLSNSGVDTVQRVKCPCVCGRGDSLCFVRDF